MISKPATHINILLIIVEVCIYKKNEKKEGWG